MSRPTQVDVAELAGVSRQTVSLVVQNDPRVSERTRRAVIAAMEALAYRPNASAQALAGRRTGFLGIVLSDLENGFHAELAEALRRSGDDRGFMSFVSAVSDSPDDQLRAADRLAEIDVDGLVLVSPTIAEEDIARLGRQLPTVVLTRNAGPDEVDIVHSDDVDGARAVVNHMAEAGYQELLYVGYSRSAPGDSSTARLEGYRLAVESLGQSPHVFDASRRPLEEICDEIVAAHGRGFGVSCHNDLLAFQTLAILGARGLTAGTDYGIAGYDNTALAGLPGVSLTSVDQKTGDMAALAADLIIDRRDSGRTAPRREMLPLTLISRRTTARVAAPANRLHTV